jgi:hypothetical protein
MLPVSYDRYNAAILLQELIPILRFALMPMPAEFVKGITEPVVTYAMREGPSTAGPLAEEAGDR